MYSLVMPAPSSPHFVNLTIVSVSTGYLAGNPYLSQIFGIIGLDNLVLYLVPRLRLSANVATSITRPMLTTIGETIAPATCSPP